MNCDDNEVLVSIIGKGHARMHKVDENDSVLDIIHSLINDEQFRKSIEEYYQEEYLVEIDD